VSAVIGSGQMNQIKVIGPGHHGLAWQETTDCTEKSTEQNLCLKLDFRRAVGLALDTTFTEVNYARGDLRHWFGSK
jgi:hypothetical protein